MTDPRPLLLCAVLVACGRTPDPSDSPSAPATSSAPALSGKPDPQPQGAAPSAAAPPTAPGPTPTAPAVPEPVVLEGKTSTGDATSLGVQAPAGWRVVTPPTEPDPTGGKFGLRDALKGLPPARTGDLVARIETPEGNLHCDLYEKAAPDAVAQFVGLARGVRPFWDGVARSWAKRPYYDGTSFHRLIAGLMIQGGDPSGDGRGLLGFVFKTGARGSKLKHDRAGRLCMAASGEHANQAQFFITERPTPKMDGRYAVFGQCEPVSLVYRLSRGQSAGSPTFQAMRPVPIEHVEVLRAAGGAVPLAAREAGKSGGKAPARNTAPGLAPPGRAVEVE